MDAAVLDGLGKFINVAMPLTPKAPLARILRMP
jgi:hypothetical protein